MATNQVLARGDQLTVAVTDPAIPASGDPVLLGQLPGVALTDEQASGSTTVKTNGAYELSVRGRQWNSALNAGAGDFEDVAVDAGDIIFYTPGRTPVLDKGGDAGGEVRFGYALAAVASGATATIPVKIGH